LEPRAFNERMREIGALIHAFDGAVAHRANGIELRFRMGKGLRAALDALAEKERSCCATLEFRVREEDESISFAISGKAGDRVAIEDLAAHLGIVLPAAELRANVHRPDWLQITLPKAREALWRRLAAHPQGIRGWEGLDCAEDRVLAAILRHFADRG